MLGKIAWKNIVYKPLNTALCIGLLLFGVGIISLLLLLQHQFETKLKQDLQNIDLVVGAKGSPLQLVLSAVYHLDAPTGNISLEEAKQIMGNPMVKEAIPLAYGDSYRGYRILGTTDAYLKKYDGQFAAGDFFAAPMQAVIGADVAEQSGLQIHDTFLGTHGEVVEGHVHDQHPYKVVGILKKSNSVLDRLVLTDIQSVWAVHDHESTHDHDEHVHEDEHQHEHHLHESEHHKHDEHAHEEEHYDEHAHNHDEHVHEDEHQHEDHLHESVDTIELKEADAEITAVLLSYKSKRSVMNLPRLINEQTNMQAVLPGLEINRLFYMLGIGATTLKLIAGGIMFMAGFSVFFVLFSRLRDRKYELALMRSVGYRPGQLFTLLLLEGLLLAAMGYVLGWLFSRIGLYIINIQAQNDFNLQFGAGWVPGEAWLLLITLGLGLLSALLPALRAMQMDVSTILSKSAN